MSVDGAIQGLGGSSGDDSGAMNDNSKGLALAISSSLFIGASFIIKKKGLKKAGATGMRAGATFCRRLVLF